jgi:hypothetical protein
MTLTDPNQALRPQFIEVSTALLKNPSQQSLTALCGRVNGLVQLIIIGVGVSGLA